MPVRIIHRRLQQLHRNAVVLHLGVHRQINHVETVVLVELGRPVGVQIVPGGEKVEQGSERRVFLDQPCVRLQFRFQLRKVVLEEMVRLGLVGNDQKAVQIRAVGKNVAVFVEFLHVAGKELRQKLLADILVGNQGLVQRVGGKALVQQCLKLWQVFFCNFV